jgi:hypothetical protein
MLNQKAEELNPGVVLTKQGVRNLNQLGPKRKPDEPKPASDAAPAEAAPEQAPADKKVGS